MKKIIAASLFSFAVAAPALAADKNSIGVTYGLDISGVMGIQGEFGISSMANGQPLSVAAYYKKAPQTIFGIQADLSALGFTVNYDLTRTLKINNNKLQPYAGVGFERITETVVFPGLPPFIPSTTASVSSSQLSYTLGAKYLVTREIDVAASYNSFGGFTLGANYSF